MKGAGPGTMKMAGEKVDGCLGNGRCCTIVNERMSLFRYASRFEPEN